MAIYKDTHSCVSNDHLCVVDVRVIFSLFFTVSSKFSQNELYLWWEKKTERDPQGNRYQWKVCSPVNSTKLYQLWPKQIGVYFSNNATGKQFRAGTAAHGCHQGARSPLYPFSLTPLVWLLSSLFQNGCCNSRPHTHALSKKKERRAKSTFY